MRKSMACLACVAILGCAAAAFAQNKAAANDAKATSAFDPHDLSGVWNEEQPHNMPVFQRYWLYRFTPEEPPMTAWGEAQFKAAKSSFGAKPVPIAETNDPVYHSCAPAGLPRVYLHPFPLQIIQMPSEVLILFEFDSLRHQIFTDGRGHDDALGPQWMGDSIGHWEGDTLVADTTNFNEKTWVDRMGHPHSEQLHLIERFRRVDHDHLELNMTVEDPKAYAKPWDAHIEFTLKPTWSLGEQFCEDEQSFDAFDEKATAGKK